MDDGSVVRQVIVVCAESEFNAFTGHGDHALTEGDPRIMGVLAVYMKVRANPASRIDTANHLKFDLMTGVFCDGEGL